MSNLTGVLDSLMWLLLQVEYCTVQTMNFNVMMMGRVFRPCSTVMDIGTVPMDLMNIRASQV